MYQFQFEYDDAAGLREKLERLRETMQTRGAGEALFHIYIDQCDPDQAHEVVCALKATIPDARFVGASTNGNISYGKLVPPHEHANITVLCNVFEDPDTRVEVLQFPLSYETQDAAVDALLNTIRECPWVNAVEMLTTVIDVNIPEFCEKASELPEGIAWFGGGVTGPASTDIYTSAPFVFSSAGEISNHGVTFVLYGGANLHVKMQATVGWKPLGKTFHITEAKRSIIYKIDDVPAYDLYYQYLKIEDDDDFFDHSVLFPLAFDFGGLTILKTPVKANDDHSLTITSDVTGKIRDFRIAYGDPATILSDIEEHARDMAAFAPQGIYAFSCTGRRGYWGDERISYETMPFEQLAPTAGFYTAGEFIRHREHALLLNVSVVTVGLREGPAGDDKSALINVDKREFTRQMALVHTLSSFVGKVSVDLEDAYRRMSIMAKTDGLTQLFNRSEIERRIRVAMDEYRQSLVTGDEVLAPSLIMADIDDFKKVNDRYGHKAGDAVLKALGALFRELVEESGVDVSIGRWGGEEFMLLLPRSAVSEAVTFAKTLCEEFRQLVFDEENHYTVSVGVVQAQPSESVDSLCMRVDAAMYCAKEKGKNRVVVQ